jgi:hypothetical protein
MHSEVNPFDKKVCRRLYKLHLAGKSGGKMYNNYGFRLVSAETGGKEKLKKWLADPKQRMSLMRYVQNVWNEWVLQDNVVSFWRKEAQVSPFLLLGETCKYSDALGIEKLEVNLGYKKDQLMTDPDKIDYIWVDPKMYDAKKWDTIIQRLLWWAGPVGFMMLAKSVSPFLLLMLKTAAAEDRQTIGAHLEEVINAGEILYCFALERGGGGRAGPVALSCGAGGYQRELDHADERHDSG